MRSLGSQSPGILGLSRPGTLEGKPESSSRAFFQPATRSKKYKERRWCSFFSRLWGWRTTFGLPLQDFKGPKYPTMEYMGIVLRMPTVFWPLTFRTLLSGVSCGSFLWCPFFVKGISKRYYSRSKQESVARVHVIHV